MVEYHRYLLPGYRQSGLPTNQRHAFLRDFNARNRPTVKTQEVLFHPVAEDDSVVRHLRDDFQKLVWPEIAEHEVRRGDPGDEGLANAEAQLRRAGVEGIRADRWVCWPMNRSLTAYSFCPSLSVASKWAP